MANPPNYYHVLGLETSASSAEIQRAFRQLARRYHPDTSSAAAITQSQQFQELVEAYHVLHNPASRDTYNQLLRARSQLAQPRRVFPHPTPYAAQAPLAQVFPSAYLLLQRYKNPIILRYPVLERWWSVGAQESRNIRAWVTGYVTRNWVRRLLAGLVAIFLLVSVITLASLAASALTVKLWHH